MQPPTGRPARRVRAHLPGATTLPIAGARRVRSAVAWATSVAAWRRAWAVAVLLVAAAAPTEAAAQSLTARTVRFDSAALGGQATFAVLLPPDYDASARRYPVVYLLHGGTQNHTAYPARRWFAKEVLTRNLIAVMPHVPQVLYRARGSGRPAFEDFIRDLVARVDATYRTVPTREARAIGGLSMGGLGAVLAGLAFPDMFGTVGAFAGAFAGREAVLDAGVSALPAGKVPFFYLACGIEDPVLSATRAFAALLQARGLPHEHREVPGGHTWDVWDPQTLAFLDTVTSQPGFAASPR